MHQITNWWYIGSSMRYVALPPQLALGKEKGEMQWRVGWMHVADPATATPAQLEDDLTAIPTI